MSRGIGGKNVPVNIFRNEDNAIMSTLVNSRNSRVLGDVAPIVYTVVIHPCVDTSGYWATCAMPDGGVTTDGETLQEVEANMFEAMDLYLEDHPEIIEYSLAFKVRDA